MKAVVKTRREPGIDVLDVEVPEVGEADILCRLLCGSVCGTDVHVVEWTSGYEWVPLPVILGHEFSGEVVDKGSMVETVEIGDRITALPLMSCSRCNRCRVGKPELCDHKLALGLLSDGAFAEYVRLTAGATVFRIADNVSNEAASLCEPLSVALHAVDLSNIRPGQTAAVLGPGPIGLLVMQVLKAAGAGPILVTGTRADTLRLEVAGRLGVDAAVDIDETDVTAVTKELTKGVGFDFVFEATGNPKSISQALSMVRAGTLIGGKGGKVILIGIHPSSAGFLPTDLVRGSKTLMGAYGYETETWQRSLALLSRGKIDVEPMITHKLTLEEAAKGFDLAVKKEAAKVVFVPQ
jgi:L-iditol 2-dehydrogenase